MEPLPADPEGDAEYDYDDVETEVGLSSTHKGPLYLRLESKFPYRFCTDILRGY
jgi:hypothetical protein